MVVNNTQPLPNPDNPIPTSAPGTSVLDGGSGTNTLRYNVDLSISYSATYEHLTPDKTFAQAPSSRIRIVGQSDAGSDTTDLAYRFQHLVLGAGNDTFSLSPGLHESDFLDSSGAPTLVSLDGGAGIDTLDLSNFALSKAKTLTIDGKQVSFGGVGITHDVLEATGTQLSNFEVLDGTSKGDYVVGSTEFKNINLGNGNNYVADVSGSVLPGDEGKGAAAHWVDIDLGSGSSTVAGSVSQGSVITADAGHTRDTIAISPNTQLVGLNPTDRLTWGGITLTGGIRLSYSDSPWAYSPDGLFEYGINHQGNLVIETPTRFYAGIGGSEVLDPATYVTGYQDSSNIYSNNFTAGIKALQVNYSAIAFPGGGIGGLVNFDFSSLAILQALSALEQPSAAQTGDDSGARWNPAPPSSGGQASASAAGSSGDGGASAPAQPGIEPTAYLVFDLSGKGIATSAVQTGSATAFDINGDGFANPSGWIGPDQGFLVLPDANGNVTGASQLMDFSKLAAFDVNGTGVLDASDPVWSQLRIWNDANGNEQVDAGELLTLAQAGLASINVAATPHSGVVQQGNLITASSTYTKADGSAGIIAAVRFKVDEFNTAYLGTASVSALAATLPDLPGHGTLLSLRQAMSQGETEATAADGTTQLVPSALEAAVQSVLQAWPTQATLANWVAALTPVFAAWAAATPDPNPGAPGLWAQSEDAQGNPIANAPTAEPDAYLVTQTTDAGTVVVDELVYQVSEVPEQVVDPATGAVTQTTRAVGHWAFASGRPVTDAQGGTIGYATLAQALATPLATGQSWTDLSSGLLDFLSRYTGEPIPLGAVAPGGSIDSTTLTGALNSLNTLLDLAAIRFATQVPSLQAIFGSISYDQATDQFTGNTSLGFEPVLQAMFAAAPADAGAATTYLQGWWPIVSDILNDFQRPNEALVTPDYVFGLIVAAWEATTLPLSLVATAQALGITTPITTGSGQVVGANGQRDVFYAGAGDTTLVGGNAGNEFVVGGLYSKVEIDVDEGVLAGQTDTLRFATLTSTEVTAVRDGNDLLLLASDGSQVVRVTNQFLWDHSGTRFIITGNFAPHYGVNTIVFADGVTWTPTDIAFATAQRGTHDQLIQGSSGHEVLIGGPNDTLEGGGGENIYVFQLGFGQDTIQSSGDDWITGKQDTLMFGPGISKDDLVFSRGADTKDLLISIRGTQDSVLIRG